MSKEITHIESFPGEAVEKAYREGDFESVPSLLENRVLQSFDAQVWANDFCKLFNICDNKMKPIDDPVGLMIGWFANSLMRGYDEHEKEFPAMPDRNTVIEERGTFACPICGYDKPHGHPEEVEQAYRNDQIRNDGWTSTAKILPSESGWYLCAGIDVPLDQKDRTKEYEKWSQLSWFKWVRNAEGNEDTLEVLYYDVFEKKWSLRNMLGDAVRSGTDLRWRVRAEPKYWRVLPSYPNIRALKTKE